MRLPRRYVFAVALLATTALLPVLAGSGTIQAIDAVNAGLYSHYWSPTQVSVAPGGEVTLRNSTTTRHGVNWVGGPATPTCEGGVPVGTTEVSAGTNWSGNCKFTQTGTYTFYCTVHGPEMTGTVTVTIPGAPTAATGGASAVTQSGATLEGTVNPNKEATTYHFNYGTSAIYDHETPEEPAGAGSVATPVSASVSGLAPGTTYHYQLIAKNGAATDPGADRTFTTESSPGAPSATTGVASAVSETAATLKGTVNPDGQATEYHFQWGTDTGYGQVTSTLPAGADHLGHAESSTLTGLLPGTVYHFRLVANNASGPSSGVDGEFTTLSPPAPTTTATATTPTTPPPTTPLVTPPPRQPPGGGSPLVGGSLKLTAPRHGSAVHGSVVLGSTGAGASLEVDLLAKGASLGSARGHGQKSVRVGRLLRTSVSPGRLSFSVTLSAQARGALARRHSLVLTVRITLTPALTQTMTLTRSLTLRS